MIILLLGILAIALLDLAVTAAMLSAPPGRHRRSTAPGTAWQREQADIQDTLVLPAVPR